nr:hypothetical protein HmN_000712600 [Hymenolepis microstoma]
MRPINTFALLFLLPGFTVAYPHSCYPSYPCLPPGYINYGNTVFTVCFGGFCQYFCIHCECCIYRCTCPSPENPNETSQQATKSYEIVTGTSTLKVPKYHNFGRPLLVKTKTTYGQDMITTESISTANPKTTITESITKMNSSDPTNPRESIPTESLNNTVTEATLTTDFSGSSEQAAKRLASDISMRSEMATNILSELDKHDEFKNSTSDSSDQSITKSTITESIISSSISDTLKDTDFVNGIMTIATTEQPTISKSASNSTIQTTNPSIGTSTATMRPKGTTSPFKVTKSYEILIGKYTTKVPKYHNVDDPLLVKTKATYEQDTTTKEPISTMNPKTTITETTTKMNSSELTKPRESPSMETLNTTVTGTTLTTDFSGSSEQTAKRLASDISMRSEMTTNILSELDKGYSDNEMKNPTPGSSDQPLTKSTIAESIISSSISDTLKDTDFVNGIMTITTTEQPTISKSASNSTIQTTNPSIGTSTATMRPKGTTSPFKDNYHPS